MDAPTSLHSCDTRGAPDALVRGEAYPQARLMGRKSKSRHPGDGFPMSIYFFDTHGAPDALVRGKHIRKPASPTPNPSSCHSERSEESAVLTPAKNDAPWSRDVFTGGVSAPRDHRVP